MIKSKMKIITKSNHFSKMGLLIFDDGKENGGKFDFQIVIDQLKNLTF